MMIFYLLTVAIKISLIFRLSKMAKNTDYTLMLLDSLLSMTCVEQRDIETLVEQYKKRNNGHPSQFLRQQHVNYIVKYLHNLPGECMRMDSSRSWFCFWGLHGLRLLGHKIEKDLASSITEFLKKCQVSSGGFSGAPGQLPHLATTYASVMALVTIGTEEALNLIDRAGLRGFISSMKQHNGSFTVHAGGEIDVRAAYCALAVANICNLTDLDELFDGTQSWLTRCQTYEGGFGGEPNCEAHGGYTFCSIAGLALMRKLHLINLDGALNWLANRQMRYEGGFQGRTNKLVDACYSYWQAACFCALESQLNNANRLRLASKCLFNTSSLQDYILDLCQHLSGGFSDKPDKHPDMYHTCYALSGLSIAQSYTRNISLILDENEKNTLEPIHPIFNITVDSYEKAILHFNNKG